MAGSGGLVGREGVEGWSLIEIDIYRVYALLRGLWRRLGGVFEDSCVLFGDSCLCLSLGFCVGVVMLSLDTEAYFLFICRYLHVLKRTYRAGRREI